MLNAYACATASTMPWAAREAHNPGVADCGERGQSSQNRRAHRTRYFAPHSYRMKGSLMTQAIIFETEQETPLTRPKSNKGRAFGAEAP